MATSKDQIKEFVKQYWKKAHKTYPQVTNKPPRVYFFTKSVVAGYSWDNSHFVSFNISIASVNDPEDFAEIVAHELAHRVQSFLYPKSKWHGRHFHKIMKAIYGKSSEYHTLKLPN